MRNIIFIFDIVNTENICYIWVYEYDRRTENFHRTGKRYPQGIRLVARCRPRGIRQEARPFPRQEAVGTAAHLDGLPQQLPARPPLPRRYPVHRDYLRREQSGMRCRVRQHGRGWTFRVRYGQPGLPRDLRERPQMGHIASSGREGQGRQRQVRPYVRQRVPLLQEGTRQYR